MAQGEISDAVRRLEWAAATRAIARNRRGERDAASALAVPEGERARPNLAVLEVERAWLLLARCRFDWAAEAACDALHSADVAVLPRGLLVEALLVRGMAELRAGNSDASALHLAEACDLVKADPETDAGIVFKCEQELARALGAIGDHAAALLAYADAALVAAQHPELPLMLSDALQKEVEICAARLGAHEGTMHILTRAMSVVAYGISDRDLTLIGAVLARLAGVECPAARVGVGQSGRAAALGEPAGSDPPSVGSPSRFTGGLRSANAKKLAEMDMRLGVIDSRPLTREDATLLLDAFDAAIQTFTTAHELCDWIRKTEQVFDKSGMFEVVDCVWERSVLWCDQRLGYEDSEMARALSRVGNRLTWTGRHAAAESCLRRAIEIEERGLRSSFWLLEDIHDLARLLMARGRYENARRTFVEVGERALAQDDCDRMVRSAGLWVARADEKLRRLPEAAAGYRKAIRVREEKWPDDPTFTLGPSIDLALVLVDLGHLSESCNIYEQTAWTEARLREAWSRLRSGDDPKGLEDAAWQTSERARLAISLGRFDEAERSALNAVTALMERLGKQDVQLARPLGILADTLIAQERSTEALDVLERELRLRRRFQYETHPEIRRVLRKMASGGARHD